MANDTPYIPSAERLKEFLRTRGWLFFGVYMLALTYLAFGTHDAQTTKTLQQFGLKETKTDYVLTSMPSVCRRAPCPAPFQYERPEVSSVPNPAGLGGYAAAGAAVTFWWDRKNRKQPAANPTTN